MTMPSGPLDEKPSISPVETSRVGGQRGNRVAAQGILLLAALAIVILKPWGADTVPPAAPAASDGVATVGPASLPVTPDPAPTGDVALGQCYSTSGWRVFNLEIPPAGLAFAPFRTWTSVHPVVAPSPADPAIDFARVVADRVTALGYCAPSTGGDRPPPIVAVEAWREDGAGHPLPILLRPAAVVPGAASVAAALYGPPAGSVATTGTWAPGRYVFRVSGPPATGFERWFGVEILSPVDIAPAPAASRTPTVATSAPTALDPAVAP
jgi:hypothetical protein